MRLFVITVISGSTEPIWLIYVLFNGKCCVRNGKIVDNLSITSRQPAKVKMLRKFSPNSGWDPKSLIILGFLIPMAVLVRLFNLTG